MKTTKSSYLEIYGEILAVICSFFMRISHHVMGIGNLVPLYRLYLRNEQEMKRTRDIKAHPSKERLLSKKKTPAAAKL